MCWASSVARRAESSAGAGNVAGQDEWSFHAVFDELRSGRPRCGVHSLRTGVRVDRAGHRVTQAV